MVMEITEKTVKNLDALSTYIHNVADDLLHNDIDSLALTEDSSVSSGLTEEGLEIGAYRSAKIVKLEIKLSNKNGKLREIGYPYPD